MTWEGELGRAVGAAAAATSLSDLGAALPHLRAAIGASNVLLYHYPDPGRLAPVAGDLMPVVEDYTEDLYRQDACHQAARQFQAGPRILRDHQLIERRQHIAGAPYNEFYRHHDIDHFACTWLTRVPYADSGMVGLLIGRSPRQGDFDDDEIARLRLALPAFVGATERGLRIALDRELFEAVLDAASIRACFALDERGRVPWASARAERLLAPILAHGAVPDDLVAAAQALLRAAAASPVRGAAGAAAPPPIVAVRIACGEVSRRAELTGVGAARRLVIVAIDEAQTELAAINAVAARHALTLAETDVLGWLVHGLPNREIAARLYVSIETVRTHLKRVFSKLGVATRGEAAMLVLR